MIIKRINITNMFSIVLASAMVFFSAVSQATLIGDEVTAEGSVFAVNPSPQSAVVGAGVEFFGLLVSVDVGASSVRATSTASARFGGTQTVILSDLDWVNGPGIIIGTENLNVQAAVLNFNITDFTDDTVTFTFQGDWAQGEFAEFDLVTEHTTVPEPTTLTLFGLGLAGLVFARRKKV